MYDNSITQMESPSGTCEHQKAVFVRKFDEKQNGYYLIPTICPFSDVDGIVSQHLPINEPFEGFATSAAKFVAKTTFEGASDGVFGTHCT